MPGNALTHCIH